MHDDVKKLMDKVAQVNTFDEINAAIDAGKNFSVPKSMRALGGVNSKTEFLSCVGAAIRAKLRNPRDVKIHVLPSLGGGGIIPHVMWEETGKNGKRYFKDFWHDAKTYDKTKHGYLNRILGINTERIAAPINFKGHVRNNVTLDEIKTQASRAYLMHRKLLTTIGDSLAKRSTKWKLGGIGGALLAGTAADHALNHRIKNEKNYNGYKGGVGKNVGTAVGALAGIPVAAHLGSLPSFHNLLRATRDGQARQLLYGRLGRYMFNGGKALGKGKLRALTAALTAAGILAPTMAGRMAGRTADAGVKAVSLARHEARKKSKRRW